MSQLLQSGLRIIRWLLIFTAIFIIALVVGLFFFGGLIYPKLLVQPAKYSNPLAYKLNPFERTKFETTTSDGLRLACYYAPARKQPARGTCLLLHGHSVGKDNMAWQAKRLVDQGFDVIAYDARAHGESDGEMSTIGNLEGSDAITVIRQAEKQFPVPHPRTVIGHSLGAVSAIRMITLPGHTMDAAVLISPYARLRELITRETKKYLWFTNTEKVMAGAEKLAGRELWNFSPIELAPDITIPTLVIHGSLDPRFPLAEGREVYAAIGTRVAQPAFKQFQEATGAGHNDVLSDHCPWSPEVAAAYQGFLQSVAPSR